MNALPWVIGAALLVPVPLQAFAQDDILLDNLTPTEAEAIHDKIASNWNVAAEPAITCEKTLSFDIRLEQGVVKDVVLTDPKSLEGADPCKAAADAAQRAIWKSSPLPVSAKATGLTLLFDASEFQ